jgi:hypothetical protein
MIFMHFDAHRGSISLPVPSFLHAQPPWSQQLRNRGRSHSYVFDRTVRNETPCQYPLRLPARTKDLISSNPNKLSHRIKDLIKIIVLGLKAIAPPNFLPLMFYHRFDKVAITKNTNKWLFPSKCHSPRSMNSKPSASSPKITPGSIPQQ